MISWDLSEYKQHGGLILMIMAIVLIAVSGIFFGVIHYTLEQTEIAFQSTDCVIEDNTLISSCQELWDMSLYPFLALREILVWLSFLLIFGLVLGMLILGYQSGKSPVLLGMFIVFIIVLTYMGIEISNMYRTLLENEIFRTIMLDFTMYNRVMMNFPWFIFVTSLFSFMLSIVNYQRTKVNTPTDELDY